MRLSSTDWMTRIFATTASLLEFFPAYVAAVRFPFSRWLVLDTTLLYFHRRSLPPATFWKNSSRKSLRTWDWPSLPNPSPVGRAWKRVKKNQRSSSGPAKTSLLQVFSKPLCPKTTSNYASKRTADRGNSTYVRQTKLAPERSSAK